MDITITMVQEEIFGAIKDFMVKHDVVTAGKEVEINLVAGRGPNGYSAVISTKGDVASIIPTGPINRAAVTPTPVVEEQKVTAPPTPNLFDTDLPADPKAAMRAKKAAPKPDIANTVKEEVDALFAQEHELTEEVEDVAETEDVLFGAE